MNIHIIILGEFIQHSPFEVLGCVVWLFSALFVVLVLMSVCVIGITS